MNMKQRLALTTIAGLAVLGLITWAAFAGDEPSQTEPEATTSVFQVTGMTCGGCEVGVRRVVKKLEGVEEVEASYEDGTATVTYQAEEVTSDDIIAAIEELGYTAELVDGEEAT
jgi:copper chaperone CopZ